MKKIYIFLSVILLAVSCNNQKTQITENKLPSKAEVKLTPVNYAYVDNSTNHVIYNGADLGEGSSPVLEGNNIAFVNTDSHLIYNGKDMGIGIFITTDKAAGVSNYPPILNSGHLAFYRNFKGNFHVIYDGKDLGPKVGSPVLEGNNIALITSHGNHVIYNGKDLGLGFSPVLSNGHIAYATDPNASGNIIYDGKNLGKGYGIMVAGNSFGYISKAQEVDHVIFNGKDLGECGYPSDMNENHIACTKGSGSPGDEYHVYYDGKDLGLGYNPRLDGDYVLYNSSQTDSSLKYKGQDIGQGGRAVVNYGNYAYEKAIDGQDFNNTTLIYNGKDLGPAIPSSAQLLGNNLAYYIMDGQATKTVFNDTVLNGNQFTMTEK